MTMGTTTGTSTPVTPGSTRAWELNALCRNEDPELWFSDRTRAIAMALCHACEVLQECRTAVLRREDGLPKCDRGGIVAGLTGNQRHALENRLRTVPALPPEEPSRAVRTQPVRPPGEPAPCGTRSAYQRHVRRGEPVDDACRAANARSASQYRRTGTTLPRPSM
ncbi:WhiB family transcriptional regulator [Streptomyces sp. NBC_01239]|uniref:WhiB family transcriptional regulator n=1 Tax=unclassified Streptomyces TaxID=2593676 RepID=UPI0022575E8F|nr:MULTISPECIES: WhiB family transcriptional regulator [unclassified Streptomyces]MCX4810770.1 WhiB family transcriptional regulator [Streptomyces sp. NBC_01239]